MKKSCTKCKTVKPLDEFRRYRSKYNSGSILYRPECKVCCSKEKKAYRDRINAESNKLRLEAIERKKQWIKDNPDRYKAWRRKQRLKHTYGLSDQDYDNMLMLCNNTCMICQQPTKMLCVDHCHTSGKVRGLLCQLCNKALGGFKDNIDNLLRAIEYLNNASKTNKIPSLVD